MGAHLRLKNVTVTDPRVKGGYLAVAAATYSDAASLSASNVLPAIPYQHQKHQAWTWTFDGDGLAIQDFADVPAECNWVIVVTQSRDEKQAQQLLEAVNGSLTAMATDARSKVVGDLGSVVATGIEAVIDHLFFEPRRLGTFIGSASQDELRSSWTRAEDRNPQPASITLGWDVDAAAEAASSSA